MNKLITNEQLRFKLLDIRKNTIKIKRIIELFLKYEII